MDRCIRWIFCSLALSVIVGCDAGVPQPDPAESATTAPTTNTASRPANPFARFVTTIPTTQATTFTSDLPTTAPVLSTRPTSRATGEPTGRADDRLATPALAVAYMLELMRKNDVVELDSIMAEHKPIPKLQAVVTQIHNQMLAGATCEIIESHIESGAAAVLYRTHYSDGRTDLSTIALLKKYDDWQPLLGGMTMRRYTAKEKSDIMLAIQWARDRTAAINSGAAVTQPTTQP